MTAETVLEALLRANLAASAAVLLVLVLRRPLRARTGAGAAYALWLLPPLAALGALVPARVAATPTDAAHGEPALELGGVILGGAAPAAGAFDLASALLWLWLAGAAAFAVLAAHRSRRLAADPALGPALVGVLRPRLVLPADFESRFDAAERRLILAHEAAHAAAGHPAINGAVEVVRCLSWFNPLAHVAAFYARVDQELACDAAVMARHPAERRTYAEALLKCQLSPAFLPLGCQWPGRSKPLLTERLQMLARPRPNCARRLAAAAAIALAAAGAGYAAWAAQPPRPAAEDAAVRAAIEAGDGLAVRARGGAPRDVIAALKAEYRTKQPGGPAYAARTLAELDRFADTSRGASLAFVPFTGPDFKTPSGKSVGGAHWGIERRTPDGMVQYVMLMKDGKLFMGAPHRAPAAAGAAKDTAAAPAPVAQATPAPRVNPAPAALPPLPVPRPSDPPAPPRDPLVVAPAWIDRPDGDDIARVYPRAALSKGVNGRATMQCGIQADGRLQACAVVSEDPEGAGFGAAALQLASEFRMEARDRDGQPVLGAKVRIPLRFTAPAAAE